MLDVKAVKMLAHVHPVVIVHYCKEHYAKQNVMMDSIIIVVYVQNVLLDVMYAVMV